MRRILLIALCFVLVSGCITAAYAVEPHAVAPSPALSFSGETAQCNFSYSSIGSSISVTLSLWNGNTLVDSWTESGSSYVSISESCSVESGKIYTLKVSGTCDGESISASPVTKTCP